MEGKIGSKILGTLAIGKIFFSEGLVISYMGWHTVFKFLVFMGDTYLYCMVLN